MHRLLYFIIFFLVVRIPYISSMQLHKHDILEFTFEDQLLNENKITEYCKKIVYALQDKNIILDDFNWLKINDVIQEFCLIGQSRLQCNKETYCTYKNCLIEIYKSYRLSRKLNFFLFSINIRTETVLHFALKDFFDYAQQLKHQKIKISTFSNLTVSQQILNVEDIAHLTAPSIHNSQEMIMDVQPENTVHLNKKNPRPSIYERRQQKKAAKSKHSQTAKIVKTYILEKNDYQEILDYIRVNNFSLIEEKFIQKIKKLECEQQRDKAFATLLEKLIDSNNIQGAYKCLKLAPKKVFFLMEYIKLQSRFGLDKSNAEIFFEYVKICKSQGVDNDQLKELIDKTISKTSNLFALVCHAKYQILINNELSFFLQLFKSAIDKNNITNFVVDVLDSGIFSVLVKFIKVNPLEKICLYEGELITYTESSFEFPQIITGQNLELEKVNSKTKSTIQTKWVENNIKFFEELNKKINSNAVNNLLAKIYLYAHCNINKYFSSINNFDKYIQNLFDTPELYNALAYFLLQQNKPDTAKLALHCYRMNAKKFNDITSMEAIIENIWKKNNIQVLEECEFWLMQIIRLATSISPITLLKLAKILYAKDKLNVEIDRKKLINCLNKNELKEAKLLYIKLYNNDNYTELIDLPSINPMKFLIDIITDKEVIEKKDKAIKKIIKALIKLSLITLHTLSIKSDFAAESYLENKSRLQSDELEKLEKLIYEHPILNKKYGWPKMFEEIISVYENGNPGKSFQEYLKQIGFDDLEITYFYSLASYKLDITEGQKNYNRDDQGNTILHHAAIGHQFNLMRFLIKTHPDLIDKTNNNNESIIISLLITSLTKLTDCQDALIHAIKFLCLENKNILRICDSSNLFPIHYVSYFGLLKLFKVLLEELDVTFLQECDAELNVFTLAIKNNQPEIIEYLLNNPKLNFNSNQLNNLLYDAVYYDKLEVVKLLLNRLNPANESDTIKECAYLASKRNNFDIIKMLIENKYLTYDTNVLCNFTLRELLNRKKSHN